MHGLKLEIGDSEPNQRGILLLCSEFPAAAAAAANGTRAIEPLDSQL